MAGLSAGLESVGDAGDHDGGDVAVDAADAGEAVSQAAGLSDFGDVVFDEPGFVGVAGVVKCMPSRMGPVVWVPSTAGRQTRRAMAERRSQAPRAPQNTMWSRSARNGARWMSRTEAADLGGPR